MANPAYQITANTNPEEKREKTDSQAAGLLSSIKLIGAIVGLLGVLLPIFTVTFNYMASVQEKKNDNFRSYIEMLSSEDAEKRLVAVSTLATYLNSNDEDYKNESLNLLIARASIELDHNVLNAINNSFRELISKKSFDEYFTLIDRSLLANRILFIQTYSLNNQKDLSEKSYQSTKRSYDELIATIEEKKDLANSMAEGRAFDTERYLSSSDYENSWKDLRSRQKELNELNERKQVSADFITMLLANLPKEVALENLNINMNALNQARVMDLKISDSVMKSSAISSAAITDMELARVDILNTVFTDSNMQNTTFKEGSIDSSLFDNAILFKVRFSGVDFNDAYFTGTHFKDVIFEDVTGLSAMNFYPKKSLEGITISEPLKSEIESDMKNISENDFLEYVFASDLTGDRRNTLMETLDISRQRLKYFLLASTVYYFTLDETAKEAAEVAYATASHFNRVFWKNYPYYLANDANMAAALKDQVDPESYYSLVDKMTALWQRLEVMPEGFDNIVASKKRLDGMDAELVVALEEGDADIFLRRYPELKFALMKYYLDYRNTLRNN